MAYHFWSRNALILDLRTVTDNLPPCFALPDVGLLRLQGVDAEVFAQSQLANDVLALEPGQWQWNCWLNAKGRVLDVMAVLRIAAGDLLLILPDGGALALGQALQRLVFRRKLHISLDQAAVSGCLAAPAKASGNRALIDAAGNIELDWGAAGLPRSLYIGQPPVQATGIDDGRWRQADLRLGLPRLAPEQRESWTAQQLGLDRLDGYSVRKGCYPGQEIVARTHFLGKAKRAAVLLQGADGALPGQAVQAAGNDIGQLACVAGPYALAVLPLEGEHDALSINGQPVQAQPIIDGLRR